MPANFPTTVLENDGNNRPAEGVHVPGTVGPLNAQGSATITTDVNGVKSTVQQAELATNGVVLAAATADAAAGNTVLEVLLAGYNGATVDRERLPNVYKTVAAVAVTAGTPAAVWTPASGKKFRLMGYHLGLSVAGAVIFKDGGNSNAEIFRTGTGAANQGGASPYFGNGPLGAAANGALNIDVTASGTVNGFVFGVEE